MNKYVFTDVQTHKKKKRDGKIFGLELKTDLVPVLARKDRSDSYNVGTVAVQPCGE